MSAALVILIIGIGTYLLRFSLIGFVGERAVPEWALLPLRYVPLPCSPPSSPLRCCCKTEISSLHPPRTRAHWPR